MPVTLIMMIAFFIVFLAVQLLCCFKAKKTAVKLIPVFAAAVLAALLIMMYLGVFGRWSAGFLGNLQEFIAGFRLIILGVGFAGDIAAWAVWLIYKIVRNKNA